MVVGGGWCRLLGVGLWVGVWVVGCVGACWGWFGCWGGWVCVGLVGWVVVWFVVRSWFWFVVSVRVLFFLCVLGVVFDGRSRRVWRRFLSCGDRLWGDALRFLASRGLRSVCSSLLTDRRVMEFARWWAHSRLPPRHWSGWGQGLRCWQLSPLLRLLSSNRGPRPFTNFLTRSPSKMTRGHLELFIHWGHFPRHSFCFLLLVTHVV